MIKAVDVTIIGGGMITCDLILPAVYNLQRERVVSTISICALSSEHLRNLKNDSTINEAFPGQEFIPHPSLDESVDRVFPDLYKEILASIPPRQAVIVALPDQFHYKVVKESLLNNQHVLCVKPLVLNYEQAVEIERLAYERGLFIGIEYHKRFDRRSLIARKEYRSGSFGEFIMGEARLIEPYLYRFSNFQNWFTVDKTDPFVYVGCHYVDLVYFITGLRPVSVSVEGVKGLFPNGNEGYFWSSGRVRFENGSLFHVTNGLGYPDDGAGSNDQGITMYCEGDGKSGMIKHDDQYRGATYSYLDKIGLGGTHYNYINPDFIKFVPWEGKGYKPVGYGVESVTAIVGTICRIEGETDSLSESAALLRRQELIKEVDNQGIIATPANSFINELVIEAARISILDEGRQVDIIYGEHPHVKPKS